MISNFQYFTDNNVSLKVNLGTDIDLFEGNNKEDVRGFYKSTSAGIKWKYEQKDIYFLEQGQNIEGYPTPDLKRVIVIFPLEHKTFKAPLNAVIFNADGSVHMQLAPPKLISELAQKHGPPEEIVNPIQLYFEKARWAKDSKGGIVCSLTIGFSRDWREERVLNPETGEFGECLSSGRR